MHMEELLKGNEFSLHLCIHFLAVFGRVMPTELFPRTTDFTDKSPAAYQNTSTLPFVYLYRTNEMRLKLFLTSS